MYPVPASTSGRSLPPRISDWPVAQQYAERLRGTVVSCGPGFRLATWPDVPITRITALANWLDSPRYIAAHLTAAWVWGACYSPGEPIILTRGGRISRTRERPGAKYIIGRIATEDITVLAGYSVSSQIRTAYDLIRGAHPFGVRERVAVRLLAFARGSELRARARKCSPSEAHRIRARFETVYGAAVLSEQRSTA